MIFQGCDRYDTLCQDWPSVIVVVDEMNSRPCKACTRGNDGSVYNAAIETFASKGWQQARVDVQHRLGECRNDLLGYQLRSHHADMILRGWLHNRRQLLDSFVAAPHLKITCQQDKLHPVDRRQELRQLLRRLCVVVMTAFYFGKARRVGDDRYSFLCSILTRSALWDVTNNNLHPN